MACVRALHATVRGGRCGDMESVTSQQVKASAVSFSVEADDGSHAWRPPHSRAGRLFVGVVRASARLLTLLRRRGSLRHPYDLLAYRTGAEESVYRPMSCASASSPRCFAPAERAIHRLRCGMRCTQPNKSAFDGLRFYQRLLRRTVLCRLRDGWLQAGSSSLRTSRAERGSCGGTALL